MPIFAYKCPGCGHELDKLVKSNEDAVSCPNCALVMSRMLSAPSFQLKGGGWYATDFSGKQKKTDRTEQPWTRGPSDRFEDV